VLEETKAVGGHADIYQGLLGVPDKTKTCIVDTVAGYTGIFYQSK